MDILSFSKLYKINEDKESSLIKSIIDILSVAETPLSVSEVLMKLPEGSTGAKNPRNSISTRLNEYSDNSKQKDKNKSSFFRVTSYNPLRFWLISRMSELPNLEKSSDTEKMTFSKAAQVILQDNDNKSMSASEIWDEISERELVETKGKNPTSILLKLMSINSNNSDVKDKKDTNIFTITQKNPIKFKLINPEEIQDVPEEEIQDVPDEEIESSLDIPAVRNPFGGESKEAGDDFDSSALFVVGESGSGKSTRILKVLRQNNHKLILIGAESAPSPNLLFDYDQSEGYILSDIAEFIISAKKDPKSFYTIIFDECHEYIDEIKRSILHAISTKRGEKRFFGVKKSVRQFFDDLETYETTSKIVPDNVGFIFISSKPDVFEYHADFMGRVDKVEVKREDPYPYPDLKYIQSKIDRQDQL
jgi:hypothetical protein